MQRRVTLATYRPSSIRPALAQTDEPTEWMLHEPAIGGREVAAFVSVVFEAGAGAVAKVAATTAAAAKGAKR